MPSSLDASEPTPIRVCGRQAGSHGVRSYRIVYVRKYFSSTLVLVVLAQSTFNVVARGVRQPVVFHSSTAVE